MKSKKILPFIGSIALTGCFLLSGCNDLTKTLPSSFRDSSTTKESEEDDDNKETSKATETTTSKENIVPSKEYIEEDSDYYELDEGSDLFEEYLDYDYDSGNEGLNKVIKEYLDKDFYVFIESGSYYAVDSISGNNKFSCNLMPNMDKEKAANRINDELAFYNMKEVDSIEETDYGTLYTMYLVDAPGIVLSFEYYEDEQVLVFVCNSTNSNAVG